MDPLSDVLSLLKPRSYMSGGFRVNGNLAVRFPKHQGIKCYAVVSGECWLSMDGVPGPVHLSAGDCFLLPRGLPFTLATDLSLTPIDFHTILEQLRNGEVVASNPDRESYIVGGHFLLTGSHADIFLGSLPPIVHIQKESDKAAMRWSLERMKEELRDPQPGGSLVAQQLAYMMIVQALRLHLADEARGSVGWLFALVDPQLSQAITCIHEDPAHRWTIQELAERVGMSRSIFALRFKEKAGATPMEYLTRWRMLLAGDRLNTSDDSISAIALSLGYESESAFGKAFKRIMGCSPRQYSRRPKAPATDGKAQSGPERTEAIAS
ncbi:AraC family transcriptional regulator [Telmatobacter sp. DSM 110680]|uniref:AraC family transcriptional regulator n=1 Tax=Telmatobacter sp. DSM 110680 TaxID=3036704 RepID=A0AAU7DHN4_9BACT